MRQHIQPHGFIYYQLPAILWAILIFAASSIPGIKLPHWKIVPSDKVVHLLIYFVLCALVYRAIANQDRFPLLARWSLLVTVVFTVVYGASDEFHQSFVPSRSASLFDLVTDAVGAILFTLYILVKRRPQKPPL